MSNEELVQEYQNGNHQALDELIQQNTGLVFYFANKYQGFGQRVSLELDDLVQEGWIGFVNAAKKFDPNRLIEKEEIESICLNDNDDPDEEIKTAKFSTYAGRAIQSKIIRAINNNIPREKKSDLYSEPIKVNSINALVSGTEGATLEIFLPDEESTQSFNDVEENIDNEILRKDLLQLLDSVFGGEFQYNGMDFNGVENIESLFDKLLDGITAKEVLLLHYGFFGKEMSFDEIGELVGLTGSRIEQIEFNGINKIRYSKYSHQFIEKYKHEYFDELIKRKEAIDKYQNPDKVIEQMEYIDNLLKQYI